MNKNLSILLIVLAAGCGGTGGRSDSGTVEKRDSSAAAKPGTQAPNVPPMDPNRKVSEQDCSQSVDLTGGNLMCTSGPTAEERRRMEEEERQRQLAAERKAREERERQEAEARARQRAEQEARERAERLAREEAERKARAAEEERLAAERKAREEQERQEAEARARQRAEQEAREAAERERQRLEQEWLAGRALLENFITTYGKNERFKEVAAPISGFLDKTRQ